MMRNKTKIISSVIIFFIVLTTVMTYPLLFKINSHIPGFSSTDEPYGVVWDLWWKKYSHENGLNYAKCGIIAYPFGIDFNKSIGNSYFWEGIKSLMAISTNEIISYNILVLSGFLLSLITMFYLMFYLCGSTLISTFSAIIFAFCPYHFARAWQHLSLSQTQWIPLYILALLKIKDNPKIKNIILLALAFFLVFSFNFYYAYFMIIVTGIFLVYVFLFDKKTVSGDNEAGQLSLSSKKETKSFLKLLFHTAAAYFIVLLILSPTFYQIYKSRNQFTHSSSGHNTLQRPFDDLFSQSARPLSYILPSPENPLLGKITQGFIGSGFYGQSLTEHSLYLGWIPLILAFIAFRKWRGFKKSKEAESITREKENFIIGLFISIAFGAWLFSQPAWWRIGPIKIYMPSFFIYKILPMFRAYCRFGIILICAIAVLAGYGLKFILGKFKTKTAKISVVILSFILVLLEFWNYPPFKVIDLNKVNPVYSWLKRLPADIVIAEYPLDADTPTEKYKFYQTKHQKKIINATIPGSDANMITKTMKTLSSFETASALSGMDVKYVLVHRDRYLNTELIEEKEELENIKNNQGLKLIKNSQDVDVYAVIADSKSQEKK